VGKPAKSAVYQILFLPTACVYIYIYIYHLSTVFLQIFFTESVMMNSGIALSMKDECHAAELDQNEGY